MQQGQQLNQYRITGKLGEGGMGEVYRAEDSKLRREVAIKVLPQVVAGDPDRLARFEREAQLLAAFNHGGIAAIYGLEEADGIRFLVMELVDGENLDQRLAAGRPDVRRALEVSKAVAEALEEAHSKGIIHRDLKPANVMVTPDGRVKVLDLGLAKALVGDAGGGVTPDVSMSPTVNVAGTAAGVILGTAAYMSPEQARGKTLDARTDIWSFGCLMYEVFTGKRAFAGETVSDLMAAILKEEPDWTALPADTPAPVRQLMQRCLQKDARRRLQAIGDARIELEDALRRIDNASDDMASGAASAVGISGVAAEHLGMTSGAVAAAPAGRAGLSMPVAVGMAVLAALVAGGAAWLLRAPTAVPVRPTTRLAIPLGDLQPWGSPAISADGREVIVPGSTPDDRPDGLYRWSMGSGEGLEPIPGGEQAGAPVFAPDGSWLAISRPGGYIARIPLAGGAPSTLTSDTAASSMATIVGDRLLFGDSRRGLSIMPANGGEARSIVEPDPQQGETLFYSPSPLPGDRHALFTASISTRGAAANRIMLLDLESGERSTVLESGEQPVYVPSGHLVFSRDGSIWAVPFDLDALTVSGEPAVVQDGVVFTPGDGAAWSVSQEGTLVFLAGEAIEGEMELVVAGPGEARGEVPALVGGAIFEWPMLSPDGSRLAAAIHGSDQHGIWVYDVVRGSRIRVSFVGNDGHPVWSPDGEHIVFYSGTSNGGQLFLVAADGSDGENATLLGDEGGRIPRSFSPDGRYLTFTQSTEVSDDLWVLDMETGEAEPILDSDYQETWGMISPDGRWLAYTSDESGNVEVYLRPFPDGGAKVPVSTDGGGVPTWSADGELLWRQGRTLFGATVSGDDRPELGTIRTAYEDVATYYSPLPGSDRLLLNRSVDRDVEFTDHITVVLHWFDELRRRVPVE